MAKRMDSKMKTDFSKLNRPRIPMPDWIKEALEQRGLMKDYKSRPAYQQNDYLRWIEQVKMQETKQTQSNAKRAGNRRRLYENETSYLVKEMNHPESGCFSGRCAVIPCKWAQR
jgi:hypothetical protein